MPVRTVYRYPIMTTHNYRAIDPDQQSISGKAFAYLKLQIPPTQ